MIGAAFVLLACADSTLALQGSATTYDFGFNAGDIMLETASDNTVPYDFFDDIQRIFSCKRVHIG